MMTYTLINVVFLAVAAAVWFGVARRRADDGPRLQAAAAALGVLLVLTAIFDNVMISVGLVDYDPALRLGWSIGVAPIEDFAYPAGAVLLLPALWHLLDRRAGLRPGEGAGPGTTVGAGPGGGR